MLNQLSHPGAPNFIIFERDREREREKERETECERGRGREREGDTESKAGSRLRAISTEPNAGLELTSREIVTGVEVGRLTN